MTTGKVMKHSLSKSKSMCAYKDTAINSVDNMDIDNAQNIPSGESIYPTKETIIQFTFKL